MAFEGFSSSHTKVQFVYQNTRFLCCSKQSEAAWNWQVEENVMDMLPWDSEWGMEEWDGLGANK